MKIVIPKMIRMSISKSAEVQTAQLATGAMARAGEEVDWPAGAAVTVWHRKGRLNCVVGDATLSPVGLHSDGSGGDEPTVGSGIDIDDLVV